jgi:hypothetical protein
MLAQTIGYSVRSDVDDILYSINLATGVATAIGPVGFADVEALAFHPSTGVLYGVDDSTNQLITINLSTGAGTAVGPLGVSITDMGLSFDCSGNLYMSTDVPENLYQLNPATGAATLIGAQGQEVTGLAFGSGVLWGLGGDATNNLVRLNTSTGAATSVGALGVSVSDGGIDFDTSGVLWGLNDVSPSQIFTINTSTGAAAVVSTVTVSSTPAGGFESLAIRGNGGCGCGPHTVHGHISTVPPSHSGNVSHQHHGQHGHTVTVNCPSHVPGHSAGLVEDPESLFNPLRSAETSEQPPLNPSVAPLRTLYARRGGVLEIESPNPFDSSNLRSFVLGTASLSVTTAVPEVRIGDAPARVLFSGLTPALPSAWRVIVQVPDGTALGPTPLTIYYNGVEVERLELVVE